MRSGIDRLLMLLLGACALAANPDVTNARPNPEPASPAVTNGPEADYPVVLGDPFLVDGRTYTPRDTLNYDAVGYAEPGEGGDAVVAAHRTLPLPSYAEVTSLATGRTILVRITRRGPMAGANLVALSPGAWAQLGLAGDARAPVRVRRVNPPEADRAVLRLGRHAPERMETPAGLLGVLKRRLGASNDAVLSETARGAAAGGAMPAPAAATQLAPSPAPAQAVVPAPAKPLDSAPATVSRPVSTTNAPPPASRAPKPAASPTKAKPTPAVPAKPAPTPPKAAIPAAPAGAFAVQVGAFSTEARARAAAGKIGAQVSASGKVWRVRLGPFRDRSDADRALAKARSAGYGDARIIREP